MATNQQRMEKYAEWLVSNQDKQGSPEWNTISSAYKQIRQGVNMPTQKEKSGLNMQDIALSAQSGLARGVESALSLPDLAGRGISFLLEKPMSLLGIERITPEEKEKSEILDIRQDIVEPVATAAGARYEPQTVAGELTQRTAELLPFAPTRPLTFAAAPAVTGYAAEKAAEKAGAGEGLQLAARIAGEIAAPVPTAKSLDTLKAITDLRKTKDLRQISESKKLNKTESVRVKRAANLEDEGIKVSTGQALNDKSLLKAEAQSSAGSQFAQSQLEDFTAAVMKKMGSTSRVADSSALIEIQSRLGGIMNDVVSGTNVKINAGDARKISNALKRFAQLKPSGVEIEDMSNYFARINNRAAEAVNNPLSPDEYVSFRQELSRLTTRSDKATKETAKTMLDVIDSAMDKTLSGLGRSSDFSKLNNARSMYRDYFALEDAARKSAGDFITPSQMAAGLKKQSARQYVQRKRGDLGNLVADADEVLKFPPTSGTSENLAAIIGPTVARYGTRTLVGGEVAQQLGLPFALGAFIANIGPATFDRLALTDKGRQYLIKKMIDSDPTAFTPESAGMIVGVIANSLTQEQ